MGLEARVTVVTADQLAAEGGRTSASPCSGLWCAAFPADSIADGVSGVAAMVIAPDIVLDVTRNPEGPSGRSGRGANGVEHRTNFGVSCDR